MEKGSTKREHQCPTKEIASKGANTRDPQKKAMGGLTKGGKNSNLGLKKHCCKAYLTWRWVGNLKKHQSLEELSLPCNHGLFHYCSGLNFL
jgi:hypothetical protein